MLTVAKIISLLPSLTSTDRSAIKAAITDLDTKSSDDPLEWLYDAVSSVVGSSIPYKAFLKSKEYGPQWRTKAAVADAFITKTFPGATKTARLALARMLLVHLTKESGGAVPSAGALAVNIDRLPIIFDQMYPGYRTAGLAHLVLKVMEGKK